MICTAWVRVAGFSSRGFDWLVLGLLLAAAEVASYIVAVCWPGLLKAAAAVISRGCWVHKSLLCCCWSCLWLLDPAMIGRGGYCRASFDRLGDGYLIDVNHARESQKQGKRKQRTIVIEQHVRAIKWGLKHSRVKI